LARLNYHHLHYFWQVASTGNLTKTAKNLHVSQSALSSQIRQLEENIGQQLFERQGRQLLLTDVGRRVLTYADDIFAKGEELESLLKRGIEPESQLLRIGMLTTLSRNFIDRLLMPLFREKQVRFSLHADSLDLLLEGLTRHQLDVVLTNADVRGGDDRIWQSQLLARQPVSIVGPPQDLPRGPFPRGYEHARWVLPTRDHEIRRAFEGFCARWGIVPDIRAEANDMAMLRLLARDSGALAVLPAVVVRDEIRQRLLMEYMKLPSIFGNFYAITVKRTFVPPMLKQLLDEFTAEAEPTDEQR
jgi:LysR family transcriptional activator of nhaA